MKTKWQQLRSKRLADAMQYIQVNLVSVKNTTWTYLSTDMANNVLVVNHCCRSETNYTLARLHRAVNEWSSSLLLRKKNGQRLSQITFSRRNRLCSESWHTASCVSQRNKKQFEMHNLTSAPASPKIYSINGHDQWDCVAMIFIQCENESNSNAICFINRNNCILKGIPYFCIHQLSHICFDATSPFLKCEQAIYFSMHHVIHAIACRTGRQTATFGWNKKKFKCK